MGVLPERDAVESTADAMAALPEVDRVAMEQARARIERRLFGTGQPARIGRYEVVEPIAGGGMGMVYRAHDPQLQRNVALKILHPQRTNDPHAQQRMVLEGRALAKLDHPNVVKVHDVLLDAGQVVVVMALLDGETLDSWQGRARRTATSSRATRLSAGMAACGSLTSASHN